MVDGGVAGGGVGCEGVGREELILQEGDQEEFGLLMSPKKKDIWKKLDCEV